MITHRIDYPVGFLGVKYKKKIMFSLSGNIYDMGNGFYKSQVYNILEAYCKGLDGHYTVLFNKDVSKIFVYKHGDYQGLTSYLEVEFKGFMELTKEQFEFFKEIITQSTENLEPYTNGCWMHKGIVFDYSFEIFGLPIYWGALSL